LFRSGWNACPPEHSDENSYEADVEQETHGRSPLVVRESPSLSMIGTLVAIVERCCVGHHKKALFEAADTSAH
jgi:hypothetical protein